MGGGRAGRRRSTSEWAYGGGGAVLALVASGGRVQRGVEAVEARGVGGGVRDLGGAQRAALPVAALLGLVEAQPSVLRELCREAARRSGRRRRRARVAEVDDAPRDGEAAPLKVGGEAKAEDAHGVGGHHRMQRGQRRRGRGGDVEQPHVPSLLRELQQRGLAAHAVRVRTPLRVEAHR